METKRWSDFVEYIIKKKSPWFMVSRDVLKVFKIARAVSLVSLNHEMHSHSYDYSQNHAIRTGLESRVQETFWRLFEFAPDSRGFNFSAALVNSQLACLWPVGILNNRCWVFCFVVIVFHWPVKSPYGEWSIKNCIVLYCIVLFGWGHAK